MGSLEKVMQLKRMGRADHQIIEQLRQQGISPKEINEALSQSKIKSMFNSEPSLMLQQTQMQSADNNPDSEFSAASEFSHKTDYSQMQPSMLAQEEPEQLNQFTQPIQETDEYPQEQIAPSPEFFGQESSSYPEYQGYQPEANIEVINEIAEQIIDEKTMNLKKQINSLTGFKEEINSEIERLNERLSKIENTLNELQVAILRKIGNYGEDIKNIAKEMHLTQDSFSKILNPLTDNIRELQEITNPQNPKQNQPNPKTRIKPKSQPNFEDYLR